VNPVDYKHYQAKYYITIERGTLLSSSCTPDTNLGLKIGYPDRSVS
jgi:hypothetical protein